MSTGGTWYFLRFMHNGKSLYVKPAYSICGIGISINDVIVSHLRIAENLCRAMKDL